MSARITESAWRIIADDGTWTKGDAVVCAEFVLAAQEAFKARIAEARVALDAGDEAVVDYLRGKRGPSYADLAEDAERESREHGYRFSSGRLCDTPLKVSPEFVGKPMPVPPSQPVREACPQTLPHPEHVTRRSWCPGVAEPVREAERQHLLWVVDQARGMDFGAAADLIEELASDRDRLAGDVERAWVVATRKWIQRIKEAEELDDQFDRHLNSDSALAVVLDEMEEVAGHDR